ncbi:putative capsid structural protein [Gordonia phage GMA6]|uniref:Putative capsid structural protein n=1 Tax=Gordonia phage GMA6 TaxID=1647285 RepID=A0A0K0NKQ8_9CAUD|nr:putative capsid structural protein [Gordonia phage GMA6]AKL88301.1 putative capsid structural protein [Gordonia phage GMA6]
MTSTLSADRIKELSTALEAKQEFIKDGLANGVKIDGNNVEIKSDDYAALQSAMGEVKQIESLIAMERLPEHVKSVIDPSHAGEYQSAAVAAAAQAFGADAANQMKSSGTLGEMFIKSDDFQEFKKSGSSTMRQAWEMEAKDMASMGMEQKDIYSGLLTGSVNPRGFGSVQFDPAVPRGQRTARVRNLFPVAATSANLIDYFRVLGFAENGGNGNARTVRDRAAADGIAAPAGTATDTFGLKPKSNLRFESAQAPVRTIAHWEAAHRNVISDEPQLQSTINNELLYGLALAEDDQILNGDGQTENLLGILNTPGIQTYTQVAADQKSDALRRSATLSVIANYPGTGFVLHPHDWEDIELQKANGDGQYMLVTNVAVGATTSVWRQPVVETPAIAEGSWLTGAFGIGAQLYDRQVASIRIAEQHADFFVRNAIAILAEERLALAVKRPESFVKGTFV